MAAKNADLLTFRNSLDAVSRQHFPTLSAGKLAIRLIPCPSLCSDAVTVLNSLSPADPVDMTISSDATTAAANSTNAAASNPPAGYSIVWPPVGCLPLFASSSPEYSDAVAKVVQAANQVYSEFTKVVGFFIVAKKNVQKC